MANRKYTYENWWNGEVTLIYASTYSNKGEKITQVDWSRFFKTDIPKIKEKQAELFHSSCENLLKQLKSQFENRYANSQMKADLYEGEWQQCEAIIFEPLPDTPEMHIHQWNTTLLTRDTHDMQYYILQHFYMGIPDDFSHVHSPNNKYQKAGTPSNQVLAAVIWDYYKWLASMFQEKEVIDKKIKSYQDDDWFIVGVKFANGELDELLEANKKINNSPNFTKTAEQLGNLSFRPYISESYNSEIGKSVKNIFSSEDKIMKILDYCMSNDIDVVDSFYRRIRVKNPNF